MKLDGVLYVDNMVLAHIVCDPDSKDFTPVMRMKPEHFQSWIDGEKPFVNPHLSARLFKDGQEHMVR